ncbi:MAG: TonB-dependent receptor [Pseudomonadota bacterium]
MKHWVLLGAAGSALMSAPAFAQDVAPVQAAPAATPPAKSESATMQDDGAQDIVVTAQRREESAQKIPVAVAVVGGVALERSNAVDVSDMAKLVPSVTFSAGNELRNNSIRVRGVGTDVFSTGVEASVSTVVDGVVLQRPGSAFSDLGDIDRIEVLRGPQGTLFGKNSSAGVINVITKAPNFDRFEGNAAALVAEDNEYRLNGAVSGPLGTQAAFRVAGFYRTQDGISRNHFDGKDINGQEAWGIRAKLAVRPSETLSLLLQADYSRLNANCCALPLRIASNNPRALPTGTNVGPDNRDVNNDVNPYVKQKNYGASLTADLELGAFTLTSISAYREFENLSDVDLDDTQARFVPSNFNIERSHTTTQELRLTSPKSDTFDYVVGLYYFGGYAYNFLDRRGLNIGAVATINPDGTIVPTVPGDQARLSGFSVVDVTNVSAFGQANLHLGDKLTLTGGLRYLDEKQRLNFYRPVSGFFNGANAAVTNPALGPVSKRYGDNALIGKASVTYEVTNDITTYVSYSTGYKSEGIAATLGLTAAQFAAGAAPAETSALWEAGLKTQFFDRRLLFNLTGFRTRFKNYQGQVYNPAAGLVVLTSVGGLKIDGFEVEAQARPVRGLSFNGGVTYLKAEFYDAPNGPCYAGQTVAQGCAPNAQGANVQSLNGKPFINAPKWRYTISGRYELPDASVRPFIQGDWRWQSQTLFDLAQNPLQRQSSYGVFDASIGAIFGDGRFDVSVFAKNLFDKHYVGNITAVSTAGGANAYAQQLPRDFDRYFGASFRARF